MAIRIRASLSLVIVCYCAGCATPRQVSWTPYSDVPLSACEIASSSPVEDSGFRLEWTPPTLNTDGSRLTDLTAYRIDWGPSEGRFNKCVWIDDPGQTDYLFTDISPGRYKFVGVAVNSAGLASAPSGFLYKSVP